MNLIGNILLERYTIESQIGRGGMAEVYKAWDSFRNTYLALKVLHEELALDRVFIRRFQREAQTLKRLQHPNIVRFYGLEESENLAVMILDYIQGKSLKHLIHSTGGPMSYGQIRHILKPALGALQFAHQSGFVHCDMKPGNILIEDSGRVLVSDFGISRMQDEATATMVGFGTPAYMAPEQVMGKDPTPQTDIYAIGVVLFEMLTGGERPFIGEQAQTGGPTSEKIRWEHVNINPPSLRRLNPQVNPELESVVMRCLDKNPDKRYASALALLNDIEAVFPASSQVSEEQQGNQVSDASPVITSDSRPRVEQAAISQRMAQSEMKVGVPNPELPQTFSPEPSNNHTPQNNLRQDQSSGPGQFTVRRKVLSLAMLGLFTIAILFGVFWWVNDNHKESTGTIDRQGSGPANTQDLSSELQVTQDANTRMTEQAYILQATSLSETMIAVSALLTERPASTVTPVETRTQILSPTTTISPTIDLKKAPPVSVTSGSTWLSPSDGMLLAYIPAGEFQMGNEKGDADERPLHTVFLDAFWMDTTEVTNSQYAKCVDDGVCSKPASNSSGTRYDYYIHPRYANYPVVQVSWEDANTFCGWANRRLPTEAEWEKAARGGLEDRLYPWGDDMPTCRLKAANGVNYGVCGNFDTLGVGSYAANNYGLFDMAGNVWEWVWDWYSENFYANSPDVNPNGPQETGSRVLRGGSWYSQSNLLLVAYRGRDKPDVSNDSYGFRCAVSALP